MNPLESSGKPLFFKALSAADLQAPTNRNGVAIRTAARSLSVMQKEALISTSLGSDLWRVSSDEGAYLDGDDVSPCPLAHMTTGMVASFMETTQVLARQRGIELPRLRLIQDNFYTMKGSALRGTMTGGALPVVLTAEIDSASDRAVVESLLRDAVDSAPVYGLISNVLNSQFTLTHNGREVEPAKVSRINNSAVPLAASLFDSAQPESGDWSGLMRRNGMSPTTDEITSSSGSSYAEEQSRRLHLRGICTVRADGIKLIEQQLFNPHGSIFHLMSDEGAGSGGEGRAPDAMSYVSAGIAFCFLTQFGRYAKIVKKPLAEYAVVQDMHFSKLIPGVSATADPVETHVHLESDQDDDFARQALDMSEQTCFLHALCRTQSSVEINVVQSD